MKIQAFEKVYKSLRRSGNFLAHIGSTSWSMVQNPLLRENQCSNETVFFFLLYRGYTLYYWGPEVISRHAKVWNMFATAVKGFVNRRKVLPDCCPGCARRWIVHDSGVAPFVLTSLTNCSYQWSKVNSNIHLHNKTTWNIILEEDEKDFFFIIS